MRNISPSLTCIFVTEGFVEYASHGKQAWLNLQVEWLAWSSVQEQLCSSSFSQEIVTAGCSRGIHHRAETGDVSPGRLNAPGNLASQIELTRTHIIDASHHWMKPASLKL